MTSVTQRLLKAFHEDHAVLGRGFHQVSSCLRAGDMAGAQSAAEELDRTAGPHIAFEERHFYPALVPLLGKERIERLAEEHTEGLKVVRALGTRLQEKAPPDDERRDLLRASEAMETHIAECGDLFEAMGRIPEAEQASLLDDLLRLRAEHPSWTASAEPPD